MDYGATFWRGVGLLLIREHAGFVSLIAQVCVAMKAELERMGLPVPPAELEGEDERVFMPHPEFYERLRRSCQRVKAKLERQSGTNADDGTHPA